MTAFGTIREWVEQTFAGPESKVFLELGAHTGEDTAWMAAIPGVQLVAFEPDPRNDVDVPKVTVIRAAVTDRCGTAPFVLSETWDERLHWTYSSSLHRPKNHLKRFPVTFGKVVTVRTVTLDGVMFYSNTYPNISIDFIWCDIQGAEAQMIRGATETLKRTRYLYMEYSDDEMYEGQKPLAQLLEMLPDFRVIELWPEDVLLENTVLKTERIAA